MVEAESNEQIRECAVEHAEFYKADKRITWDNPNFNFLHEICISYTTKLREAIGSDSIYLVPTGSILHSSFLLQLANLDNNTKELQDILSDIDIAVLGDTNLSPEDYRKRVSEINTEFRLEVAEKLGIPSCDHLDLKQYPVSYRDIDKLNEIETNYSVLSAEHLLLKVIKEISEAVQSIAIAIQIYPDLKISNVLEQYGQYTEKIQTVIIQKFHNQFDGDTEYINDMIKDAIFDKTGRVANSITDLHDQIAKSPYPPIKLKHIERFFSGNRLEQVKQILIEEGIMFNYEGDSSI